MTVPSTTRRAGPYPGNGVATSFPFSFKVYAKADISVVFANSLGVESTLVLDSDYSVTLNADQNANPGGTILYPIIGSPMLSSQALAIVGGLDYAQTTALPNGGAYNATIVERALDRITILTQQLRETVNRGVQLAFTTASNVSSRLPAPRGGSVLGWAADGLSLTNFDAAGLGVSVSYAAWQTQTFNGTGAQTAFVLTSDAGVASNCDVVVGGVAQTPGINFSYDSLTKTITFLTGAPPVGTNNVAVRYGQALAQGTIAAASITDSTATGRAVLTAASQAAARTAIGAQASGSYAASGANSDITSLTALASVPAVVTTAINAKKMAQSVTSASAAVATGTTIIPRDDTIPQQTEGDQYLSVTITPQNATSTLEIEVLAYISAANSSISMTGALFQDSTANALTAENQVVPLATQINVVAMRHVMTAGTTSATTFKFRAGGDSVTTLTLNGASGARLLGGVLNSRIIVKEYLP